MSRPLQKGGAILLSHVQSHEQEVEDEEGPGEHGPDIRKHGVIDLHNLLNLLGSQRKGLVYIVV